MCSSLVLFSFTRSSVLFIRWVVVLLALLSVVFATLGGLVHALHAHRSVYHLLLRVHHDLHVLVIRVLVRGVLGSAALNGLPKAVLCRLRHHGEEGLLGLRHVQGADNCLLDLLVRELFGLTSVCLQALLASLLTLNGLWTFVAAILDHSFVLLL